MKGRKPIPDNIKRLAGTHRKSREKKNNLPPVNTGNITPPSWLDAKSHKHFNQLLERLEPLGLASSTYSEIIATTAMRFAEVEELTASINKEGLTYLATSTQGETTRKRNPAMAMRAEALRHLHSLLAELGLSPASCGKVPQQPKKTAYNPWEELSNETMEGLLNGRG
jgi:P27 family predicted phage terminase small subunit